MQRYRIRLLERYSQLHDIFSAKSLDIKTQTASLRYIDAGSQRLMSLQQATHDADAPEYRCQRALSSLRVESERAGRAEGESDDEPTEECMLMHPPRRN